ncbi:LysR family transcriptional regulator [Nisaea sp.]|uniref:LysR family transcriptional regulator n=1 Tax=Nisaea sp. TaxID=2024842 RepID=UPI0032EB2566
MLNSRWLHTFVLLAETRHFTRAAELLGMTQPGVSQHLRKLEEQIGRPLISQVGKSFSLTAAGESVLAVGQRRREEEKILRDSIWIDDPEVGNVLVACSGSFATLLFPSFFPLMEKAPGLAVRLEAMPEPRIVEEVVEGRFDLGVVTRPPEHVRLVAERIGSEELCLVLPKEFAAGEIAFSQLDRLGFIAHPDGYAYADALLSANFPDAFNGADQLRLRSFVNQIGQIPAPMAHGFGFTVLPRSGVDSFPERERLSIAMLPHAVWRDIWLIRRRDRRMAARMKSITGRIHDVAAGLAGDHGEVSGANR